MRSDEHLESPVVNASVALEKDDELGVRNEERWPIAHTRPVHRGSVRPIIEEKLNQ